MPLDAIYSGLLVLRLAASALGLAYQFFIYRLRRGYWRALVASGEDGVDRAITEQALERARILLAAHVLLMLLAINAMASPAPAFALDFIRVSLAQLAITAVTLMLAFISYRARYFHR